MMFLLCLCLLLAIFGFFGLLKFFIKLVLFFCISLPIGIVLAFVGILCSCTIIAIPIGLLLFGLAKTILFFPFEGARAF